MTNKIVYNACYGGFGLSDKAYELYAEMAGITLFPEENYGSNTYWTEPDNDDPTQDRSWLYANDLDRHDKILVQVVEQLGKEANGMCANLKIYKTDSDKYIIEEYDGYESVVVSYDNSWVVIK